MTVREWIDETFDAVLVADGFDDALLGVASSCGRPDIAIYDYERCVEVLVKRDGMDEDEAVEYIEFNVTGAYVGPEGPLFMRKPSDYEYEIEFDEKDLIDQVELDELASPAASLPGTKEKPDAVRPGTSGVPERQTVRARKAGAPGRKRGKGAARIARRVAPRPPRKL